MSNAKPFGTDWRGPGSWTGGDHSRLNTALWSVGPYWAAPAYGAVPITGASTLLGGQFALATYNGGIAGAPGDPDYDINTEGVALGYDLFPMIRLSDGGITSRRMRSYGGTDPGNPGNETFSWNLTRGIVCRWLAARYAARYGIFAGFHVDYFTPLSAMAADQDLNPGYNGIGGGYTDTAYMLGMNRTVHELRRLRTIAGKTSLVIGQQFQNMNGTTDIREFDARYIEQDPGRWSNPVDTNGQNNTWQAWHQTQFDAWAAGTTQHGGSKTNMVVELAYRGAGIYLDKPYPFAPAYQTAVINFASTNTCYVSWGRDAQALIGWPG